MAIRLSMRRLTSCAPGVRRLSSSPEFGVYAGKEIPFVTSLEVHAPGDQPTVPCFRIMDEDGSIREGATAPELSRDECLNMYSYMVRIQEMDRYFYEAQRQGRISFYMQAAGEEGIHIGTASALDAEDEVFSQYREQGVLMWRGFSLQQFADQCFSNVADLGKGRQMPVHYGSKALHFQTISSPLTTQLPQAVGAAYALKQAGKPNASVVFFGEGAASEGDFHAAMNFASVLDVPAMFMARNNGFAISTPVEDQYAGDGMAARAIGYGMNAIRVDGNDLFAVRVATEEARRIAVTESKPVLIEFMTYREGHHSTSDDSTRYRSADEIEHWRTTSNPIVRFQRHLRQKGWWDDDRQAALISTERATVLAALAAGEKKPKPAQDELFTDVYDSLTPGLEAQKAELEAHIAKYPERYTSGH